MLEIIPLTVTGSKVRVCVIVVTTVVYLDVSGDGTLDRYEKKLDAVENGSFPPAKEVADFEQAIELTGNTQAPPKLYVIVGSFPLPSCRR